MKLKFQKRSELKFVGCNETKTSKAMRIEVFQPNYPIPIYWDWKLSRLAEDVEDIRDRPTVLSVLMRPKIQKRSALKIDGQINETRILQTQCSNIRMLNCPICEVHKDIQIAKQFGISS